MQDHNEIRKERLDDNPCRGLVLGKDNYGKMIQLSWIMGRSENSQNRVYTLEDEILRTEAADPEKVEDPSLIIYNVMRSFEKAHIVSNGDQTDTIVEAFEAGETPPYAFFDSLENRYCEPDVPNFTPRISGLLMSSQPNAYLSILRPDPIQKKKWVDMNVGRNNSEMKLEEFPTIRDTYQFELKEGVGHCITTYSPGSQELPTFLGPPFEVPLDGSSLRGIMETFWGLLDSKWKVSLGGKEISSDGNSYMELPINRFEKVSA